MPSNSDDCKNNPLPGRITSLLDIAQGCLGATGPVASLIPALNTYFSSRRIANIEHTLSIFAEKLRLMNTAASDVAKMSSEARQQLWLDGIEKAQKEHREFKRACYGNLLASTHIDSNLSYEHSNIFLRALELIDEAHLLLLLALESHGLKTKTDKDWMPFVDLHTNCPPLANEAREIARIVIEDLARFTLIKTKGPDSNLIGTNPIGLWYTSKYSITSLGIEFLAYIRDGHKQLPQTPSQNSHTNHGV